ncbi:MAG: N-acetyltransferase [Myxococcaceae bacterium]|nr:N-acetyltransferase [Myxococcaceae bacterium]MCA3010908.1 N-acetyltransferase [Myxococcaceae bacterium]
MPRFATAATDVVVEACTSQALRDEFVRFPLTHYAGDPVFVQPIVAERRDFIDARINPFFEAARATFFVARRGGRVVGRIAACVDTRFNRFHGSRDGFLGLFESQSDPALASALFQPACEWLRQAGMTRVIGPVNLAFHHDVGVLIDGFEQPHAMMNAYNHRFYASLFEANGFVKLKDLVNFEVSSASGMPEKVVRLANRVRASGQVRIRQVDTSDPEGELRRIKAISESMLRPGAFGLSPMSEAELSHIVKKLRPLILFRPELCLVAEVGGEPVAFCLTVPDTNSAVKEAHGTLFPFGLARMLWAARRIQRLKVLLFGIKAGFRRRGIDALLAHETFLGATRLGYTTAEVGWMPEDDKLLTRMVQTAGGRRIKTYRVYERPL